MQASRRQVVIICLAVGILLASLIVFLGMPQRIARLGEEEITLLAENLCYIPYSSHKEENINNIRHLVSEDVIQNIIAATVKYRDVYDYMQGSIPERIIIQEISTISNKDGIIIKVDFMENSLDDRKMTSIIDITLKKGEIEYVQVNTLFDDNRITHDRM